MLRLEPRDRAFAARPGNAGICHHRCRSSPAWHSSAVCVSAHRICVIFHFFGGTSVAGAGADCFNCILLFFFHAAMTAVPATIISPRHGEQQPYAFSFSSFRNGKCSVAESPERNSYQSCLPHCNAKNHWDAAVVSIRRCMCRPPVYIGKNR